MELTAIRCEHCTVVFNWVIRDSKYFRTGKQTLEEWLKINCSGRWYIMDEKIHFDTEKDAMFCYMKFA
jgi:hypothetical protein